MSGGGCLSLESSNIDNGAVFGQFNWKICVQKVAEDMFDGELRMLVVIKSMSTREQDSLTAAS